MIAPIVFCAYFVSILNFYHQSSAFTNSHNIELASYKTLPTIILIASAAIDGDGIAARTRVLLVFALIGGAVGDFVLGLSPEGIVPGAIAFGVGHVFYMCSFVPDGPYILWPLAAALFTIAGAVCYMFIMPMMQVFPLMGVVLASYVFILTLTLLFSGSQCFYGTTKHPPLAANLQWRAIGFTIFYASDALLFATQQGFMLKHSEVFVLSAYYVSQYIIIHAAILSETDVPIEDLPTKKNPITCEEGK